jgi:hypothetical protein
MNHWQSTVVHTHGWNSYVHFALLTAWLDPLWDGKTLCGIRHWGHPPVSPSIKQNRLDPFTCDTFRSQWLGVSLSKLEGAV